MLRSWVRRGRAIERCWRAAVCSGFAEVDAYTLEGYGIAMPGYAEHDTVESARPDHSEYRHRSHAPTMQMTAHAEHLLRRLDLGRPAPAAA